MATPQIINEKVWLRCDECGDVLSFYVDKRDHQYIRDAGEGCGWMFLKGNWYCTKCKENH